MGRRGKREEVKKGGGERGNLLLPRVQVRALERHLLIRQHIHRSPQRLRPTPRTRKHIRPMQAHQRKLKQLREVKPRRDEPRATRVAIPPPIRAVEPQERRQGADKLEDLRVHGVDGGGVLGVLVEGADGAEEGGGAVEPDCAGEGCWGVRLFVTAADGGCGFAGGDGGVDGGGGGCGAVVDEGGPAQDGGVMDVPGGSAL